MKSSFRNSGHCFGAICCRNFNGKTRGKTNEKVFFPCSNFLSSPFSEVSISTLSRITTPRRSPHQRVIFQLYRKGSAINKQHDEFETEKPSTYQFLLVTSSSPNFFGGGLMVADSAEGGRKKPYPLPPPLLLAPVWWLWYHKNFDISFPPSPPFQSEKKVKKTTLLLLSHKEKSNVSETFLSKKNSPPKNVGPSRQFEYPHMFRTYIRN